MSSNAEKNVYVGKDLEAMSFAVNYHRWILKTFKPYLGKRLVEVGAGTGSFSELLLECELESISLVEPSLGMHAVLREQIHENNGPAKVRFFNSLFTECADQIKLTQAPDSILYVNVLEHIEYDESELRVVWETLDRDGRVFIFVPALPWLYGPFDKDIAHFRRYTKSGLERTCSAAGFKILKSTYFDLLGVPLWWFQYKLLRRSSLEPRHVRLYDKLMVPITQLLETVARPPIGKNLLLIGQKTT